MTKHEFTLEQLSGIKNVMGYPEPPSRPRKSVRREIFRAENQPVRASVNPQKTR